MDELSRKRTLAWFEDVIAVTLKEDLFESLYHVGLPNVIVNSIVELVNQTGGGLSDVRVMPEFLGDYYLIREHGLLNERDLLEMRWVIMRAIETSNCTGRIFNSYDEFKILLEPEIKVIQSKLKDGILKRRRFLGVDITTEKKNI